MAPRFHVCTGLPLAWVQNQLPVGSSLTKPSHSFEPELASWEIFQGLALPEKEQNILIRLQSFFFLSMLHQNKKISRIGFKSQETDSSCGKCYKKVTFQII